MKRKLLLISVLAVLFSLTGCTGENEKAFDYDESALIQQSKDIVSFYNDVSDETYEYLMAEGTNAEQTAVSGFRQAEITDKIGDFISFDTSEGKVSFEDQSDGTVLVTIYCDYTGRDVEVTIQYEENLLYNVYLSDLANTAISEAEAYGYTIDEYLELVNSSGGTSFENVNDYAEYIMDMYIQNGYISDVEPYTALECEVSAVYTTKELLIQAAQNTGIGMGTVFVLLIVISFIIYLLKFVPMLIGGAEKKAEKDETEAEPQVVAYKAPAAAPKPAPAAKAENPENDAELVAVITAAIYAYESQNGTGAVSKDRLVVRSIRRAGRR